MIEFKNKIIQFGFGAVGKSFFEKVSKEIKFDYSNYYVISKNKLEYTYFLQLGGKLGNFILADINRNNYIQVFSKYIDEGDILIDFADSVGTKDFIEWCARKNVMYLNTGETDWDDNWYNIFDENIKKNKLREEIIKDKSINKCPIVIHHGNNPGLVSHFVKAGIEYIVKKQYRNNKKLNELLSENKYNELARQLDIKEIHVNDNDYQVVKDKFDEGKLYNTWSIDSFFFEMISEATANIGTCENIDYTEKCNRVDTNNGFLEYKNLAIDLAGKTYYPKGKFEGFVVPHEETITIAKSLEVKENGKVVYRPTTIFLYSPCDFATEYLKKSRIAKYEKETDNLTPSSMQNNMLETNSTINNSSNSEANSASDNIQNGKLITNVVRGFRCPKKAEILYREKIKSGTEYVGILLLGSKFKPVWVGNRIEKGFLYRNKKTSFWQTPTITPVAMSALAACCWMIKNKNKPGIYFPDDIIEYKDIIKLSEKYISKTIYKTFRKEKIEHELEINLGSLQLKDIIHECEGDFCEKNFCEEHLDKEYLDKEHLDKEHLDKEHIDEECFYTINSINAPSKNYVNDIFEILIKFYNGSKDDYDMWYTNTYEKNKSKTIMCLNDNKVVGFLIYNIINNDYIFSEVGIKEEYRHKYGILRMLYSKFLESNTQNMLIRCNINPKNEYSKNVHMHIGFKENKDNNYGYYINYKDLKEWINK